MKKLILGLVAFMVAMSANAQCNFSGIKVTLNTQMRSYYKFLAEVDSDSCTEFFWMADYTFKGQKYHDTIGWNNSLMEFQLNVKGTSYLYLKVINRCEGCDTLFTFPLTQIVFAPKVDFYGVQKWGKCKDYEFAMSILDSCVTPYWYVFDYSGNQIHYDSGYTMEYTFPWEGKFEVYAQWWNHCVNQDTFFGKEFDIICDSTLGLKPITPSARGMARPNPTSCEFYITNTRGVHEYMIVNPAGTIIAVGHTDPFEEVRIETCLWPNGVYYLLVEGLGRELIMIQH